ncbi:MAG: M13 family metallopeptidase [Candidatus Marinimicrobia bacterium]|nr:M13 family metallopeptidase [Candidatus Neomarinimicrobiota bacterium]
MRIIKNSVKVTIAFVLFMLLFNCEKQKEEPAINLSNMDTTVNPGDNFYQYVNANWLKNNPVPEDKSYYGAFTELRDKSIEDQKKMINKLIKQKNKEGTNAQKIADFYSLGMDTNKINELGIKPLQKELDAIESIKTTDNLIDGIAHLHSIGISAAYNFDAEQDLKNSEMVITWLDQGGLGLPDRDYYLEDTNRSKEIRKEYVKHIVKMFQLIGLNKDIATQNSLAIMDIETSMAKASMSRLKRRNPNNLDHKMTMKELTDLTPNLNWKRYFSRIGLEKIDELNIASPKFISEINNMIPEVSIDDWKIYLQWNLINRTANYLNSEIENEDFAFYGKVLSGQDKIKPRWERVLNATNRAMGFAVGELYVKKYFPPESKERMLKLVMNLKKVLGERIQDLDWMEEKTKEKALEKLGKFNVKIGYPDKWRDYGKFAIEDDSYVKNYLRANEFEFNRQLNKIGKPVDKDEWGMYPQTVNAYYHPLLNEIVFPAAILQPPFFYKDADDAVNYGAIGVVIGHEMTHGYDDSGRKFDSNGNLNDWWTKQDAEKFNKRTQVVVEQFNKFTVLDSFNVSGELTLGENLADYGGLTISFNAFMQTFDNKEKPGKIDGFTPEQRFFLSYAKVWRNNIRDKLAQRLIKEDVHSPGKYRVNGGVANIDVWYKAFNIQPEDELYVKKENRLSIW